MEPSGLECRPQLFVNGSSRRKFVDGFYRHGTKAEDFEARAVDNKGLFLQQLRFAARCCSALCQLELAEHKIRTQPQWSLWGTASFS